MKEVFGVQLDSNFYNNYIEIFDTYMNQIFGSDMKKIETIRSFEHMGNFVLKYIYFPHNYEIIIENEIRTFDIGIVDEDTASNSLCRITKFKCTLEEKSIKDAIYLLKDVLTRNDFNLYLSKDGKVYKKNSEGIKRIKDLKELWNG